MRTTLLFLCCWLSLLCLPAQTPFVADYPLGPIETLDAMPRPGRIGWWASTDSLYYLYYSDASNGYSVQRPLTGGTEWAPAVLPATLAPGLSGMHNGAGGATLALVTKNVSGPNGNSFSITYEVHRTFGEWTAAQQVFSKTYFVSTVPNQPFQVPYLISFTRLADSVFYLQIYLSGQQGAPSATHYFYSQDNGSSWQPAGALAGWKAGEHFLSARAGYFLRSVDGSFSAADTLDYPDGAGADWPLAGVLWRADTLYAFGNDGILWTKTGNEPWQADSLPHCSVLGVEEYRGFAYASTSDGVYRIRHPRSGWEKLLDDYPQNTFIYRPFPWMADSTDLALVTGAQGVVHSADGGQSWQKFHRGLPQKGANSLDFLGDSLLFSNYFNICQISADGHNWHPLTAPQLSCSHFQRWLRVGSGGFWLSAHQTGLASTPQVMQLLYTPDGVDWTTLSEFDGNNAPQLVYGEPRLWLVNYSEVRYTDDLGQQWSALPLPPGVNVEVFRGFAGQGDTVLFLDFNKRLYRTIDGGQQWDTLTTPLSGQSSVWLFRQGKWLLYCGPGGRVWASADWGGSWAQTCPGLPGYAPHDNIYYAFRDSVLLAGSLFLSGDAGGHWLRLTGDTLPYYPSEFIWNEAFAYFTQYNLGIFRAPLGAMISQLAQLDQTLPSLAATNLPPGCLQIFPNPVCDWLSIKGLEVEPKRWSILNATGQSVAAGPWSRARLDVRSLPAGVYFLQLQTEDGAIVRKFLRQ